MPKFRLPPDPPRSLGGKIRPKKDRQRLDFDIKAPESHLNGELRKLKESGKIQLKGSYKAQKLREIRKECRANKREIQSPVLREFIAARFRKP